LKRRFIRWGTVTRMILLNCGRIRANCLQKRLQFDRERGREIHRLAGLWMGEGEMGSVEEVTVEIFLGGKARDGMRGTVECVADDRVAEGLSVHADLVGATGFDADFDQSKGTMGGG